MTLPTVPPFRRQAPRRRARSGSRTGFPWGIAALGGGLLMLLTFAWGQYAGGRNLLWGFVAAPLLIGALYPLLSRMGAREPAFDLTNLLLTSLTLHYTAAYFRLTNASDGAVYARVGAELAKGFRRFDFTPDLGRRFLGTGFLRYLSGLVQLVTFTDRFTTFLVFATIAFLGTVLLYRAFLVGLPDGDRYRYAVLLFFWPSLIFWPSSIGKEAWMLLGLGVAACGAARMLQGVRGGFVLGAIGLGATALVRPHVAFLVLAGMFAAYVLRHESHGDSLRTAGKIVGVTILLLAAGLLSVQTSEYFQVEDLGADSIEQVSASTSEQTGQGGSEFEPVRIRTPFHYPLAAVTVLLRPFAFEVSSAEGMLTALESTFLVLCFVVSIPRLRTLPRQLRRTPYLTFALTFIAGFVFAFSAIANFGILARQRTQVVPFVLVFLALPPVAAAVGSARDGDPATGAPAA